MLVRRYSPVSSAVTRALAWALVLALLAPGGLGRPRAAAGDGDIKVILTDSIYGAAAGAFLGGVLMLVVDKDHRDDSLRWGIVLGTFAGFAYGIYETRGDGRGYSELPAPDRGARPATPAPEALDPAFAAWADSVRTAQSNGSALLSSLVGAAPFHGGSTALGAEQRR